MVDYNHTEGAKTEKEKVKSFYTCILCYLIHFSFTTYVKQCHVPPHSAYVPLFENHGYCSCNPTYITTAILLTCLEKTSVCFSSGGCGWVTFWKVQKENKYIVCLTTITNALFSGQCWLYHRCQALTKPFKWDLQSLQFPQLNIWVRLGRDIFYCRKTMLILIIFSFSLWNSPIPAVNWVGSESGAQSPAYLDSSTHTITLSVLLQIPWKCFPAASLTLRPTSPTQSQSRRGTAYKEDEWCQLLLIPVGAALPSSAIR